MGRIIAIDYGKVRTGIAVTDELQLSINGLPTVPTLDLWEFVDSYIKEENVSEIVMGWPTHKDGSPTVLKEHIERFEKRIELRHPHITTHRVDEQFSSVEAQKIILESGIKKKKRRDKKLTDKVSAMIILQRYIRKHL